MGIHEKLMKIQTEIKAPKNLRNTFGNYNYRNAEGIFNAVKPYLAEQKCSLTVNDCIEAYEGRVYVVATAKLTDIETSESVYVTAYARESESKKGMDDSQITGATSSYARKYALNGLFLLDDTKDADTDEHRKETEERSKKAEKKEEKKTEYVTDKEKKIISGLLKDKGYTEEEIFPSGIDSLTMEQYGIALQNLQKMGNKA